MDAYHNAMCESFFATLECELLDRTAYVREASVAHEIGGNDRAARLTV